MPTAGGVADGPDPVDADLVDTESLHLDAGPPSALGGPASTMPTDTRTPRRTTSTMLARVAAYPN